ncbi:hypothetical protein PVK06_010410 [Gossypium arboreum]|uniref:Uncharacterized protein n=1 Tax=Gossypium arboreum TaxID=29729 RepID=A0ABR0Q6D1_GOSAR|nr:hypothetical protein PVK06_010410 [Gossypium arboreum]
MSISNRFVRRFKFLQSQSKTQTPMKEVMHDVPMPSVEATVLAMSISNKFARRLEFLQYQYEVQAAMEEVVHDIPNFDDKGHYIIDDQAKLNDEFKQVIGIRYHDQELKMEECVSDPIDVGVGVNVGVTTNSELKLVLNECVIESVHFLAIVGEMPTKGVDEFVLFSFKDGGIARVTKASRDIGVKMHEVIIPRNIVGLA